MDCDTPSWGRERRGVSQSILVKRRRASGDRMKTQDKHAEHARFAA